MGPETEGQTYTGVDAPRAYSDIKNFQNKIIDFQGDAMKTFNTFFEALIEGWACPYAAEKTTEWKEKLNGIAKNLIDKAKEASDGATYGAYKLADACHVDFNAEALYQCMNEAVEAANYYVVGVANAAFQNGGTGMVLKIVREKLAEFKKNAQNLITEWQGVPKTLAVYNADGGIYDSYTQTIDDLRTTFEGIIDEIIKEIEAAIEEETKGIEDAEKEALAAMGGQAS